MKCVICKKGRTVSKPVRVTLEACDTKIVLKSVPAEVCKTCGEQYVDEKTSQKLLAEAERVARSAGRFSGPFDQR
ncbi:MAG: type II toxin-antitoxin system MqsA family antitoxin [bacterium]|nr:type II toxin-antitoxin system MqsA family antitoxin [bacterium]